MKILVLGSNGQLGHCLFDEFAYLNYNVSFFTKQMLDVTDFCSTKKNIYLIQPDILINATGFTAVEEAEKNPCKANLINNLAVANIAEICQQINCTLIHFSTDYVFNGELKEAYTEDSPTDPLNVYGETKLLGELAIHSCSRDYLIIRTSWLFSKLNNNFVNKILLMGEKSTAIDVINDQFGCPTYAPDLAKTVITIIPRLIRHKPIGIFHYAGNRSCSWAEFARVILEEAFVRKKIEHPATINPVSSVQYGTNAQRPANSTLDSSKIQKIFGCLPSNWNNGINEILKS